MRSNLIFAAVYNGLGIVLAATGLLHPVAAALLMVASSFTVSWRALRSVESAAFCCALPIPGFKVPMPAKMAWRLPGNRSVRGPPFSVPGRGNTLKRGQQTPPGSGPQFVALDPTSPSPSLPEAGVVIRSRWQWVHAMLVIAQAPFLIYLGQLGMSSSILVSGALLGLGILIARFRTGNAEVTRWARMTFAMLGPGNWGMILGWWADAGFVPVSLGCPHCASSGFSFLGVADTPWMSIGMLLLGLPPMVLDPTNLKRGLGHGPLVLLSTVGMVWGMSFGNHVGMNWLGPLPSDWFLLSFAGMTLGMLMGMFLCCELGRALSLSRGRRLPGGLAC
jgi:hypothetical protein